MAGALRCGRRWGDSLRVGTDLVQIAEVAAAVARWGDAYLRRVFAADELAACRRAADWDIASLAARFAAKEAVMKLLRPDAASALAWTDIVVQRERSGAPAIRLSGLALPLARRAGLGPVAVSLSHDGDYACATAIANCRSLTTYPENEKGKK